VCIIDENTGRMMADRTWSDGLHQMVELKEGLPPSPPHDTQARITFQRFFRRYRRLAGMTGTAADASWEFWSVYRLRVVRIPTNHPDARRVVPDRVFPTAAAKWRAIGEAVAAHHAQGAPVLLGTRTVSESERASALLSALGIPHQVLSAAQDADEAAKIAIAGQLGAVTVATSMAGRGVDIPLGPGVADLGGLHVILAERHDSRRVDRQLAGRCGRQGEPGRVATFLSLEDGLMQEREAAFWHGLGRLFWSCSLANGVSACVRMRQRAVEGRHAVARRDLLEADRSLQEVLAVSGRIE
jgi:preprotein translocase subunit SecA